MGSLVNAICSCGFNVEKIGIGAGMFDFKTRCSFPCYCNDCKAMFVGNLLAKEINCTNCNSINTTTYDHDSLHKGGDNVETYWNAGEEIGRVLVITDGNYKCSRCESFSMVFRDVGCFD